MLPVTLKARLFLYLSLGFIIAVVAGTLLHECGHHYMAKLLGYTGGSIHYGFSYPGHHPDMDELQALAVKSDLFITAHKVFPQQARLDALYEKIDRDYFLFAAGGPLQTMLTGTNGFLLLFFVSKKATEGESFKFREWLFVFITLFWLRQPVNLLIGSAKKVFSGEWGNGDEGFLSIELGWPRQAIYIVTGAIGLLILAITVFKFMPKHQRFTFLLAGFTGGGLGFILWLYIVEPIILP